MNVNVNAIDEQTNTHMYVVYKWSISNGVRSNESEKMCIKQKRKMKNEKQQNRVLRIDKVL